MVAAIRQHVTVQPGGVVEIRSPELPAGARAEVIVLLERTAAAQPSAPVGGVSVGEPDGAWERLRRHAGAISSGDPHGSDNERIDADLAREYIDPHDPTPR
jgi:hypothetical protein